MIRQLLSLASRGGPPGRLTTLIFHRVLPQPDDLLWDEMHAARFDEMCGWLAEWFTVLPLDQGATLLRQGRLPPRALCITFDDGYSDNHDVAMPILLRHRFPATFFIATGFLDGGTMWNDTVIESIRMAENGEYDLRQLPGAGLGTFALHDVASRRQAVSTILNQVKYLSFEERKVAVRELAAQLRVKPRTDLMMTSQQVRQLHQAGMQIGAHTVSHPILTKLEPIEGKTEMQLSKASLESLLGSPVSLFAYPNGKPGQDFTQADVESARQLGFEAAVTTARGVACRETDPYQIPRFTPWDQTRSRFGLRLASELLRSPLTHSTSLSRDRI